MSVNWNSAMLLHLSTDFRIVSYKLQSVIYLCLNKALSVYNCINLFLLSGRPSFCSRDRFGRAGRGCGEGSYSWVLQRLYILGPNLGLQDGGQTTSRPGVLLEPKPKQIYYIGRLLLQYTIYIPVKSCVC